MWTKKLQSYVTLFSKACITLYITGCGSAFTSFGSNNDQTDGQVRTETINDAGYKTPDRSSVVQRKETSAPKGSIDSGGTVSESSVDAGSEPDATIPIQDSGHSETEVKEAAVPVKPWWLQYPDRVCVPGNPKMCASGCSCGHNNLPWCCV